ncbi:MAG: hypothetical protein ACE149_19315 [Armatimonadota bacterium]
MFRRWAETRLYRRTMQLAIAELRRAARTANVLEKLVALDTAEQKLRDAQWLSPDDDKKRFETGLGEIAHSRGQTLDQAVVAVERLLEAAEKGLGARPEMLGPAGAILSFLNHYLPEDRQVEALNARFLGLGGQQRPYTPVVPLWEMYQRPADAQGCLTLVLVVGAAASAGALVLRFVI